MSADLGDYWSDELLSGLARDPDAVLQDVKDGALTVEEAKWHCGVVCLGSRAGSDFAVDREATERMRRDIRIAGAAPSGA